MKGRSFIFYCLLLLCIGCSQAEKDRDIKQTIASRAKEEISFAGVDYTVVDGVVTLTGNCPTEKERSKVESTVKETSGVKEVVNSIAIGPVELNADHSLKQSVDSVLKKYPTVQASVQDRVITVLGVIDSKKAQKLFKALQSLKARGLTNGLVINSEGK